MSNDNKKNYDVPIEGHTYDGIQELDNPLPGWWLATLYLTIIFSVGYFAYYNLGSGPTLTQEFEANQKAREIIALSNPSNSSGPSDSELNAILNDTSKVAAGKEIYTGKCAACHGPQGQGVIGPNLTDKYWIHGSKISDIYKIIKNGVNEKGMPPWGGMLKQEELITVSAYVKSLKGTNPANPKAPQGNEVNE